jgi:chromosome segregation ATPase
MKSLVFTFAVVTILSQSYLSQAQSKDSAKTIKQISDLQAKLAGLNSQLSDAKEQLRVDSTSFEAAFASSQQALMAAKDAANKATSGNPDDLKISQKAASQAKDAADQTRDAKKKMDKTQEKIASLSKQIAKEQQKLDKLQPPR